MTLTYLVSPFASFPTTLEIRCSTSRRVSSSVTLTHSLMSLPCYIATTFLCTTPPLWACLDTEENGGVAPAKDPRNLRMIKQKIERCTIDVSRLCFRIYSTRLSSQFSIDDDDGDEFGRTRLLLHHRHRMRHDRDDVSSWRYPVGLSATSYGLLPLPYSLLLPAAFANTSISDTDHEPT